MTCVYCDLVSEFLDEYRACDQKNEIISREYLFSLMIERYPQLERVSGKALRTMITALVEKKGGQRIQKSNSDHLKYFWPIPKEDI